MVYKRRKRKVKKEEKATQERKESPKQQPDSNKTKESLIIENGLAVESLLSSSVWTSIVKPLIDESIASVSGRFTNGRFWHGSLTRDWANNNSLFFAAYQKALMDLHNNLHDFVVEKNKLIESHKNESLSKNEPLIGPLED